MAKSQSSNHQLCDVCRWSQNSLATHWNEWTDLKASCFSLTLTVALCVVGGAWRQEGAARLIQGLPWISLHHFLLQEKQHLLAVPNSDSVYLKVCNVNSGLWHYSAVQSLSHFTERQRVLKMLVFSRFHESIATRLLHVIHMLFFLFFF